MSRSGVALARSRAARMVAAAICLLVSLGGAGLVLATPLGTAFTYQGQLRVNGAPVNGTCDLQFSLFDAPAGGTLVGATQAATGVTLVDGRFTVQLDFGAAFDGNARWLQTATRCPSGSGSFTALDPRQPLTPSPYALFAQTAGSALNAWSLTGNAGTVAGTNFLGTTDNQPLEVRAANTRAILVRPADLGGIPNVIMGDASNTVDPGITAGVIAGGERNKLGASGTFIGGAGLSTASGTNAAVVGGGGHTSSSLNTVVLGGEVGTASGTSAAVVGGQVNTASAAWAAVVGGTHGTASGGGDVTLGGIANVASGSGTELISGAIVAGGSFNTASGDSAMVASGDSNTASGNESMVAGGVGNTASGNRSMVAGGASNTASGIDAVVLGGAQNVASAEDSLVGGVRAGTGTFSNVFVWSDGSTASTFDASATRQFSVLATGGIRMLVGPPTTGCTMTAASPTWTCTSDRNAKTDVVPADAQEVLTRLRAMPMQTYAMIAGDPRIRHLGPMAQDFYAAFGLGENDRTISTIDLDGVSLASIQALDGLVLAQDARLQDQDARIADLERERDGLQARLDALDALDARLAALEQGSTTPPSPSAGGGPSVPVGSAAGATVLALAAGLALPSARRLLGGRVADAIEAGRSRPPGLPARDLGPHDDDRAGRTQLGAMSSAPPASVRPNGSRRKRGRGPGARRGRKSG